MKKLFILFIAVAGFGLSSYSQSTVTKKTATATAEIVRPLTLSKDANLNFGKFTVDDSGLGTVVVAASASPGEDKTGSVKYIFASPAQTAAKFTVGGDAGYQYQISMPETLDLINTDGTTTIVATLSLGGANPTHNAISESVANEFYIGGSLAVSASQLKGVYTTAANAFEVTVTYE